MTSPVPTGPVVPIGPTTIAGWGAALVGAIGFILVQFLNVDQDEAAMIATAVFTVVSFAITQFGRYQQAKELAKPSPVVVNQPPPVG